MKISKMFIFILAISLVSASCKNNSKKAETTTETKTEATSKSTVPTSDATGKFSVDTQNSSIMWTGKKVLGSHNGAIKVSKGVISVENGKIKGGAFELDMNSISNTDIADSSDNADLVGHLKSPDFFDTANHPHAYFTITKIEELEQNMQNINHKFYGDLEIKGIKKPIEFTANLVILEDKFSLVTPSFNINRTDWGVNFHSGILGTVKDKIIDDNITLVMEIKGKKQ